MKTSIFFNDLRFFAHHGVLPQERIVGNTFSVSLHIEADLSQACQTDDIADTINYATVYDIVKAEMAIPSNLLEHLAMRIVKNLKQSFPQIIAVEVRVEKPNPPISGDIGSVGVVINA